MLDKAVALSHRKVVTAYDAIKAVPRRLSVAPKKAFLQALPTLT
jgi:hypothetical protein